MDLPIVLHIPHASWAIPEPYLDQFAIPEWELIYETLILTDWLTDELFSIPGAHRVVAPMSRLLVDTERYTDDQAEPMAAHGMGVIYTRGSHGQKIRGEISDREGLLAEFYYPHHRRLTAAIDHCLAEHDVCLLVDCHSFPDTPFPYETGTGGRPDFCLGTTDSNSPDELVSHLAGTLQAQGFTVAINSPFQGCIMPPSHAGDHRVRAIMVEVNRRLYMTQSAPPYSPDAEDYQYQPIRSRHFWEIKRVLRELVTGYLGTWIGFDKAGLNVKHPPEDQQNLNRFLREQRSGNITAEMQQWWDYRY